MTDIKKIAARFRRYVDARNDMIGLDPDIVHSLHMRTPHEVSVTLTDLTDAADALDALAAQEPVSKVIVCPVCYSKEVASDFLDGETSCGDCCAVWNERKRVAQSIVSEMQNELDFLRAEVEVLRKQLHLANIDACNAEAELNSAAPQPAQSQEPVAWFRWTDMDGYERITSGLPSVEHVHPDSAVVPFTPPPAPERKP